MKKQFRIYFNGKFQCSVSSTETPQELAKSAAQMMGVTLKSADFSPGVINLRTF